MVTPDMTVFEAGLATDGFSSGSMVYLGAMVGMNDNIFDAPLLQQLSYPLHGATEDQSGLFQAADRT
jgi:hypothetical protein